MKKLRLPLFFSLFALSFASCSTEPELEWPRNFYNPSGFNNGHLSIGDDTEIEHFVRITKSNRRRQDQAAFHQFKSKPYVSEVSGR